MNRHLTEQQILECVAGTAVADSLRHVEECAVCAAEVNRLESAVGGFAAAVRRAAVAPAPRLDWAAAREPWVPVWRLAVAALALLLLAIPIMFRASFYPNRIDNTIHTTAQSRQQQLERERADVALLEQVDAAVSRPVPQPIEPLVQLVAWGSQTN